MNFLFWLLSVIIGIALVVFLSILNLAFGITILIVQTIVTIIMAPTTVAEEFRNMDEEEDNATL